MYLFIFSCSRFIRLALAPSKTHLLYSITDQSIKPETVLIYVTSSGPPEAHCQNNSWFVVYNLCSAASDSCANISLLSLLSTRPSL